MALGIISDDDTAQDRDIIIESARQGSRLLGRPFAEGTFDFGAPAYLQSIYQMGEEQRQRQDLKNIKPARGSADSIYLNRAYFGVYSLMGMLQATIRAERPDV